MMINALNKTNLKNLFINFLVLFVPALPILFFSTASDFFKGPIFIFVLVYSLLFDPFDPAVLNSAYEIIFCFIVYLTLIIGGVFLGKKSKWILLVFSIFNVFMVGYIASKMGG